MWPSSVLEQIVHDSFTRQRPGLNPRRELTAVTCVMASTVNGEPATWVPCSVMATLWRPTSPHGTATLYAPPPSASAAATARPHPLGPALPPACRQCKTGRTVPLRWLDLNP